MFKIPAGTSDDRRPNEAMQPCTVSFRLQFQQFSGNIFAIDPVDYLFQIPIAGSMESDLAVHHIFKRNLRTRKRQMLQEICHIARLCLGSF